MAEARAPIDVERLPKQVQALVEIIDIDETLALLRAHGGRPIYIPADPGCAAQLHHVLSAQALALLCAHCGNMTLELPMPDAIERQLRRQAIRSAKAAGETTIALARRFGLTRRHVLRILYGPGA